MVKSNSSGLMGFIYLFLQASSLSGIYKILCFKQYLHGSRVYDMLELKEGIARGLKNKTSWRICICRIELLTLPYDYFTYKTIIIFKEKIEIYRQWVFDLSEQNVMLYNAVVELEDEASRRVTVLENKLHDHALQTENRIASAIPNFNQVTSLNLLISFWAANIRIVHISFQRYPRRKTKIF